MHRMTTFQIKHAGKTWSGEWSLVDGKVRVDSAYGSESRAAGRMEPAKRAEKILRELAEAWRGRSRA